MPHLASFAEDCRDLDPEAFSSRHGEAFLVLDGTETGLRRPGDAPHLTVTLEAVGKEKRPFRPRSDFLVFPLRGRDEGPLTFYSVGRAFHNDVCVPDESLSIYHAFFMRSPDGRFFLQDAGSRNGTAVDGVPVPAAGRGRPVELATGARLRFGDQELTFLTTGAFCELVRGCTGT